MSLTLTGAVLYFSSIPGLELFCDPQMTVNIFLNGSGKNEKCGERLSHSVSTDLEKSSLHSAKKKTSVAERYGIPPLDPGAMLLLCSSSLRLQPLRLPISFLTQHPTLTSNTRVVCGILHVTLASPFPLVGRQIVRVAYLHYLHHKYGWKLHGQGHVLLGGQNLPANSSSSN